MIKCKHNTRWHHVSKLKASAFCYSQKTSNVNKTHQLIPGIGTATLGVGEPHSLKKQPSMPSDVMLSVVPLSVVATIPTTVPPSLANISNSSPYDSNFGPKMSFL